jgi:hypothetical protein
MNVRAVRVNASILVVLLSLAAEVLFLAVVAYAVLRVTS